MLRSNPEHSGGRDHPNYHGDSRVYYLHAATKPTLFAAEGLWWWGGGGGSSLRQRRIQRAIKVQTKLPAGEGMVVWGGGGGCTTSLRQWRIQRAVKVCLLGRGVGGGGGSTTSLRQWRIQRAVKVQTK